MTVSGADGGISGGGAPAGGGASAGHGGGAPAGGGAGRSRIRVTVAFGLIGVLILVAAAAIVVALRLTVYSASGFVEGYLHSLADHDAAAALGFPGVRVSDARLQRMLPAAGAGSDSGSDSGDSGSATGASRASASSTGASDATGPAHPHVSRELLRGDVLGSISHLRTVADTTDAHGRHRITVAYRLGAVGSRGTVAHATTFTVQRDGSIAGLLPRWRFSVSPLAIVRVTVANAHTFTLAGHVLDVRAASGDDRQVFGAVGDYLVFSPSALSLGHHDALTSSHPVRVASTRPGGHSSASIVAQPTEEFTARVQKQLDGYLDGCARQTVLQPTGCPMGKRIDNRVLGTPEWSIAHYPTVTIAAGSDGWTMPPTAGTARLKVKVQSLFDGSISDEDFTVPFTVSMESIAIQPDGSLAISVSG